MEEFVSQLSLLTATGEKRADNVQITTTGALDVVALTDVATAAHLHEAWAATVEKGAIRQALGVTLDNSKRVRLSERLLTCLERGRDAPYHHQRDEECLGC